MRRWFLVFLLLMVQLQFVWGAAAAYCGHETSGAPVTHFGHHEHRHQGDDPRALTSEEDSNGLGILHADCGSCHFGTSGTLPAPGVVVAAQGQSEYFADRGPRFSSHVPSAPERPDRIAHVAAA
ncbi:MAG: cation efflux protein, CzcI family [Ramlibacter sp.]